MAEPLALSIHNMFVRYPTTRGWVQAIRGVSLDINSGEFVGVAGESGSGKSTLVLAATRILASPNAYVEGDVTIVGKDIFKLSQSELKKARWKSFSFVTQSAMNALNPVMRIRAQMMDTLKAHDPKFNRVKAQRRCEEVFQIVELSADKLDRYPHQLSGGQRQRAVIALALLLQPELIIMDEPTTALDVVAQREIIALIRQLQKEYGFAVMFITHDLSLLLEVADRVLVLYGGRVMEMGKSEILVERPEHPYSRALINSFPPLHGTMERREGIAGSPPDMLQPPPGCPFAARCPLVIPVCHQDMPPLLDVQGRQVACHAVMQTYAEEVHT